MTSSQRAVWVAVMVVGCAGRAGPSPPAPSWPVGMPPPTGQVPTGQATGPLPQPTVAPTHATGSEQPGRGSCGSDADCVLTSYQEGCCLSTCQPYASNRRDLEAREAAENCEAQRGKLCPPPAPCRQPTHRVTAARCSAGQCVAVRELL